MNGIIIIDKPEGWTSHDVVGKLRGILRERRIGHGGTLDPMATGVLPVFVGRATRAVEFCENADKEYIAGFRPGVVTDTQDITGTVLSEAEPNFTEDEFLAVLETFKGKQSQIPPMYSAIKVGGKKLYDLARNGVEVERKPREIEIKKLDLIGRAGGDYIIKACCTKGTYIRTLCHDIGAALGCGGTMSSLRRVRAGAFDEKISVTIDDVIKAAEEGKAEKLLMPVDSLFSEFPEAYTSGAKQDKIVRNGGKYKTELHEGFYRVYSEEKGFLMLGKSDGEFMATVKSFFEVE